MLIRETFVDGELTVESKGNVFAAVCFLHGLSVEELSKDDLDVVDPDYEVIVTAVATKAVSQLAPVGQ